MRNSIIHQPDLLALLVLSFLGFIVIGILTISPAIAPEPIYLPYGRSLVGFVFGSICILGILAVFFPRRCTQIFYCSRERSTPNRTDVVLPVESSAAPANGRKILQHHPNCPEFSSHEFKILGRSFCAGCTGLLVGAVLSLVGTATYFFNGSQTIPILIGIGILGVILGLLVPLLDVSLPIIRFILNIFFVLGMFLMLIGVDTIVQNVLIDLLLVSFCVFWLFARISLSQWSHKRICSSCGKCEEQTTSELDNRT